MKPDETPTFFASDRHNKLCLFFALAIFLIEMPLLIFHIDLLFVAAVHTAVILLLGLILSYAIKKNWDLRFILLLAFGIAAFGPFGSLAFFSCMLFYTIYKRLSTPFEKWYAALFPDMELTPASRIYERIVSGWDDYKTQREVISFQDIMRVGSMEQKQTALEMIIQNFNPLLAPILKSALDDPNNQVRVQAASIVAKIDRDFEEKKIFLLRSLEQNPEQPQKLLGLAEHLDAYAFAGILDMIREKEYREMAVEYYKKYVELKPEDHQAWMALGRLLNRINAFDQVMEWFEERLQNSKFIPASGFAWYWEALYMLRSFNKLSESTHETYRQLLKSHPQKNLLECVELWAQKK
jgi:polysaccharide biosynthesis protein PelE